MKKILFPLALFFVCESAQAQISNFIHVDQFGYERAATKVAVLSDPQTGYNSALNYTPSATLQLRDANTNAVVFSAAPSIWNGGSTHTQSGDKGWWFDFSSVTADGSYYVYDVGNNQRSANFEIGENPYGEVLKAAGRMFYYNRCNTPKLLAHAGAKWTDATNFLNPLQDANCRLITSPGNAALEKDLSGGWFDAGDYNKYVSFTHGTMHDLLYAYEENMVAFGDDWNIPESSNGIPDLIDEIKWELDWLLKMTNADGSAHIKVGSQNYSENTASPPSANTDPRFYGPTCTSASATAASVFAHASLVFADFAPFSAYSTQLETEAIQAFNYVLPYYNSNTLQTNCDNGSIVSGDSDISAAEQKDMMLTAAIYLFEKTGNATYQTFIVNNYASSSVIQSGYWSVDAVELQDALLRYTSLPTANSSVKTAILNSATPAITGNWNGFFGWVTDDLYRANMPDWSYHWGSNRPKAKYANLNNIAADFGIGSVASLRQKAAEQLHYFHGVNPLGMVYLTNMYALGGDRCANEMYHTWFNDGTIYDNALTSANGPAPGYVVGGANKDFGVTTLSPPYNQPIQKSYKDWNTGYPENSWEITEPGIYYQAAYLRLLARYAQSSGGPLGVEQLGFQARKLDTGVLLEWATAQEINHNRFEIERSQDGENFLKIGAVGAKQNPSTVNSYHFIDENPLELAYYRYKQVDNDGSFAYSNILRVEYAQNPTIFIYPNPSEDKLYFNGLKGNVAVHIQDFAGRTLKMLENQAPDGSIDISDLADGLYLLTLTNASQKTVKSFVVKH